MSRLACAFLIVTIMIGGLLFLKGTHAETFISGKTSTVTWTSEYSPYSLIGDVIVDSGATLTIQPGVTVNFGLYSIIVNGVLSAQGTNNSKIFFSSSGFSTARIVFNSTSTAWNEQLSSGSIIDNAFFYSLSIVIEGSSPKISNNYFSTTSNSPITINGGFPIITKNVINFVSSDGIHINYGSPEISLNVINGAGQRYGIYNEGTAIISDNNITGCYSGICAIGQSTIQKNNIVNNVNDGIRSNNSYSLIQNNALSKNLVGISGNGVILNNTIANNNYGLWAPNSSESISYNNIFDNAQNVHLTENASNVNAFYNWWGTTDAFAINQTIWDFKNATNLGTLNFIPFLNQTNPFAPLVQTLIAISQPSPTATSVASPTLYITPTPTSYFTATPEPTLNTSSTPQITQEPQGTPFSTMGQFSITEIVNLLVIVLAVALAVTIIVVINIKSRKTENPRSKSKRRRHKPKNVQS